MNKLIGYTELNINGEVIPVKFGLRALEYFIAEYGIKFADLPTVFEVTDQGVLPTDLIKFLRISVRSGANYYAKREGKGENYYSVEQVEDWIEEIGITSPDCMKIIKGESVETTRGTTNNSRYGPERNRKAWITRKKKDPRNEFARYY